jgi:peptide deformylase
MAILNIIEEGDDTLRKKCRFVERIDDRIIRLLDDMRETMLIAGGIGLAAPQVGVLRRVAIVDNGERIIELINPEIIEEEGVQEGNEACLSVPGRYGIVKRPMKVRVRAMDRDGKEFTVSGEELIARAYCHELNHLDGILYTDLASEVFSTESED